MAKSFHEQNYPVAIVVRVYHPDLEMRFVDGIKGLNKGHALYMARLNWDGCEISYVRDMTKSEVKGEFIADYLGV